MMGTLDPSPIPPYAVSMWADDNNIYVALPMTTGGAPYITRFPLGPAGLTSALNVLRARRPEVQPASLGNPLDYTIPKNQPQVKLSKAQEKLHSETTPAQREAARAFVAKLGLGPKR